MTTDPSLRTRSTTDQSPKGPNLVGVHNKGHGDDYTNDDDKVVMMCLVYNFISYAIKEKHKVIMN